MHGRVQILISLPGIKGINCSIPSSFRIMWGDQTAIQSKKSIINLVSGIRWITNDSQFRIINMPLFFWCIKEYKAPFVFVKEFLIREERDVVKTLLPIIALSVIGIQGRWWGKTPPAFSRKGKPLTTWRVRTPINIVAEKNSDVN